MIRHSRLRTLAGVIATVAMLCAPSVQAETVPTAIEVRGLEILSTSEGFQDSVQIGELLQRLEQGEFNQIFPEVRTLVGVAYKSDLENEMPFLRADVGNPLSTLRNSLPALVEMFPWVHTFPAHNSLIGKTPMPKSPLGVAPGMADINIKGEKEGSGSIISLDPGHPYTREYLVALFLEMVKSVRPHGIVLDDFWYQGDEWGYSEGAINAFRAAVGGAGPAPTDDPTWSAWRRAQLTETLRYIRTRVHEIYPTVRFAVVVDAVGEPPATWEEWTSSDTYTNRMQDWLGWCQEGLVDEVILRYHKRQDTAGLREIELWSRFLSDNCLAATPILSVSGKLNFTDSLVQQYRITRARGIGTSLHHYASPTREQNAGFYSTLPVTVFTGRPGIRLAAQPLTGTPETRKFELMANPPRTVVLESAKAPTPTPEPPLTFTRPTPVPTPTPNPVFKPAQIIRTIVLKNGRQIQGKVTEIQGEGVVIQLERGGSMELRKRDIEKIIPPIPEAGM